ncbi:MAG: hypothetical protein ABMA15_03370 [Vicinamibacterales bacterium]
MSENIRSLAAAAAAAGLLAGAGAIAAARETRFPAPPASADSLYITSGETVRRLTAGYSTLAADLYWIRAVQYYGGIKLQVEKARATLPAPPAGTSDYALLHPLLDLTTTLDPKFNIAYRFGSIFLAEPYPGGAGRPDLAVALLEKGLAARPDKWEYMQDIGFVYYWWVHDYQAASHWFQRASDVPGAPWFLRSLAATTLAEGGDRQSSRTMWQAIKESAEIDWLRTDADRRLQQLDAMDFIDQVQADVNRARTNGAAASTWQDLIRAGAMRGLPVDPSQTPLELDPAGTVRLSKQSPLFPLPEEPQRAVAIPRP